MDACMAVDREIDKVLEKFGDIRQSYSDVLQQLIDNLESVKNDFLATNSNNGMIITNSVLLILNEPTYLNNSVN